MTTPGEFQVESIRPPSSVFEDLSVLFRIGIDLDKADEDLVNKYIKYKFQGYEDANTSDYELYKELRRDFNKFEEHHWEAVVSLNWTCIITHCYTHGIWLDLNEENDEEGRAIAMTRVITSKWNNTWSMGQIEWVESHYGTISPVTQKQKDRHQGLDSTPNSSRMILRRSFGIRGRSPVIHGQPSQATGQNYPDRVPTRTAVLGQSSILPFNSGAQQPPALPSTQQSSGPPPMTQLPAASSLTGQPVLSSQIIQSVVGRPPTVTYPPVGMISPPVPPFQPPVAPLSHIPLQPQNIPLPPIRSPKKETTPNTNEYYREFNREPQFGQYIRQPTPQYEPRQRDSRLPRERHDHQYQQPYQPYNPPPAPPVTHQAYNPPQDFRFNQAYNFPQDPRHNQPFNPPQDLRLGQPINPPQNFNTGQPYKPPPVPFSKELMLLDKTYRPEDKFSRTGDNFEFKLAIFHDKCRRAGLPPHAYIQGASIMLTGQALIRFYAAKYEGSPFDVFVRGMKQFFEGPEWHRLNLTKWQTITLSTDGREPKLNYDRKPTRIVYEIGYHTTRIGPGICRPHAPTREHNQSLQRTPSVKQWTD